MIGTGDLSEIALGWATYNGDHMSSYSVNASIPKTLVTKLIEKIKDDQEEGIMKDTLTDILNTPISPELLPLDAAGHTIQSSEASCWSIYFTGFFFYIILCAMGQVLKNYIF